MLSVGCFIGESALYLETTSSLSLGRMVDNLLLKLLTG